MASAFLTLEVAPAGAQAIVTNGAGLAIGINETGSMNVPQGFAADSLTLVDPYNSDATSPGCLCEGFGVSAVDAGLRPIFDTAGSWDWDIPPTTFTELVTISGALTGDVIESCDSGFELGDPTLPCAEIVPGTTNVSFVDSGPADHGALFTFGFGALADTLTRTFSIFYGATAGEAAALAALGAVGAETVYSFGQPDLGGTTGLPATFIFGFKGVGAPPVLLPPPPPPPPPPPGDDPPNPRPCPNRA